jgi:hypothetical protein
VPAGMVIGVSAVAMLRNEVDLLLPAALSQAGF